MHHGHAHCFPSYRQKEREKCQQIIIRNIIVCITIMCISQPRVSLALSLRRIRSLCVVQFVQFVKLLQQTILNGASKSHETMVVVIA